MHLYIPMSIMESFPTQGFNYQMLFGVTVPHLKDEGSRRVIMCA